MTMGSSSQGTPSRSTRKHAAAYQESQGKQMETLFNNAESRSRFEAYSRLQASAVAFGERLPIPEIVAVGGQSDGKSSLLEALLGFRFNVREVEMGTRRPLMLQMTHDPSALEPRCHLQDEDSDEYGSPIIPASSVAEAIRARTEEYLKKVRAAVSSKPVVMRVEYAFCPNLTIIDTPGFVLKAKKGEPENTPDEIMSMVKVLATPQHRLLVFLQQSSVEWCSSLWLDSIRAIDPSLRRSVIVISKFDNRLKEFAERWEVDRYLSAAGYLGESARPFFVALPKDRSMTTNEEFRRQIANVDSEILRHLRENIKGGFDEEQFGDFIGFANLRRYLETELQRRYREAAPATLALLEQRCSEVTAELLKIDAKLAATSDVASLRRAAMMHSASLGRHVAALIDGAADPDPAWWGRTTEEERAESGVGKWPGLAVDVLPPNATLKLYGGAAFERVLNEFRTAACSIQCPPVSKEKVANILLAHTGRGGGATVAAAGIARAAARSWLGPLLDTACDRLAHVLRSLFDLAIERNNLHEHSSATAGLVVTGYVAFHAALRRAFDQFVKEMAQRCKELVRHHLEALTSPFSQIYGFENFVVGGDWESPGGTGNAIVHQPLSSNLEITEGIGIRPGMIFDEDSENNASLGTLERQQKQHEQTPCRSDSREPLKESQMTVPETPSPDQGVEVGATKRREFGLASGRLGGAAEQPQQRKWQSSAGQLQKKEVRHCNSVNSGRSPYAEVCTMAADHFARIREMLIERSAPSTLNSGFLMPCREQLVIAMGLELFAVSDEKFMDMFVAPGAVEQLQIERTSLQKRSSTLKTCLQEFRNLTRSL